MEEKVYKGLQTVSQTSAVLGDDGTWEVVSYLTSMRKENEDSEWEQKQIGSKAYDTDLQKALQVVSASLVNYLKSVNGDLFREEVQEEIPEPAQ